MSQYTQDQIDEVEDLGSLHHYRIEIPKIIGKLKLGVYAYRLYGAYKDICGDRGVCFMSNTKLAEECEMSKTTLEQAKKTLQTPREELGGLPLIVVTKRLKANGGQDTDLIQIVDLWPENMMFFNKRLRSVPNTLPQRAKHAPPSVPNTHKEDLSIRRSQEELTPKSSFPKASGSKASEAELVSFSCLKNLEIPETTKRSLSSRFSEEQVKQAVAVATHPKTVIKKNLEATIVWACANNIKPPVEELIKPKGGIPEEVVEANREKFRALERANWHLRTQNQTYVMDYMSYGEIYSEQFEATKVEYSNLSFEPLIRHLCRKFQLRCV